MAADVCPLDVFLKHVCVYGICGVDLEGVSKQSNG
jgi:hypothetical protein